MENMSVASSPIEHVWTNPDKFYTEQPTMMKYSVPIVSSVLR